MNLFDVLMAANGPISIEDIATKTSSEPDFIKRIIALLVPLGFVAEPTPGTLAPTPLTPVLSTASPMNSGVIHLAHVHHIAVHMPEFFQKNGYKNPEDTYDSPYTLWRGGKRETYFDLMALPENARLAKAFNDTMQMQKSKEETAFAKGYPAEEKLKNEDPERVLFVDVGGGVGHVAQFFRERMGKVPGKVIVEDLPAVVNTADLPQDIVKVGHDFFKPQPDEVKGAKAYYLRMVLHDWPNMQARQILEGIRDVMADDSVVLVHEIILPESGLANMEAKMDWHMLNMSAQERTEKQWARLAESSGLEMKEVWFDEVGNFGSRGVMEMVKKA